MGGESKSWIDHMLVPKEERFSHVQGLVKSNTWECAIEVDLLDTGGIALVVGRTVLEAEVVQDCTREGIHTA